MVSLSAVEALATELWPSVTSVVVALPDARKGERLVLMTTDAAATRDAFARFARQKGANELMVPADILLVPSVPLLGSGKPDYVAALALAKERMASQPRRAEALVAEPVLAGLGLRFSGATRGSGWRRKCQSCWARVERKQLLKGLPCRVRRRRSPRPLLRRNCCQAETRKSLKGTATPPCRLTSQLMPGWKRDIGRRLDALIEKAVPHVRKAVKWNTPLYGADDDGWFLSFHCFTNYVKVAFFRGAALSPCRRPVQGRRTSAICISTRTNRLMKRSSSRGCSKRVDCPESGCDAGVPLSGVPCRAANRGRRLSRARSG